MSGAREGEAVSLELELYDGSGRLVDRTPDDQPQRTVLGSGSFFAVVEQAAIGMQLGESRELELPPEQAYGPRLEHLVLRVPGDQVPADTPTGSLLQVEWQGSRGMVRFLGREGAAALVDANHPLAGQELRIVFRLVARDPAP